MAVFGDDVIREAFACTPKKCCKSSGGALLFLAALIMNEIPQNSFTILSPTIQISQLTFGIISGAIRADPALEQTFIIRETTKEIEDRRNGSKLNVRAFDTGAVTGIRGHILVDELHEIGKSPQSDKLRAQMRGALATDKSAKIIYISTVSDDMPRGLFKQLYEYGMAVRDGEIVDPAFLYCGFQPWPDMPDPMRDESVWPCLIPVYPNVGDEEFYRGTVREALEAGPAAIAIARSQFWNQQPTNALRDKGWYVAQHWEAIAPEPLPLDRLIDEATHIAIGIDIGGASDFSSLACIGVMPDKIWACWQQAWLFESAYNLYPKEKSAFDVFLRAGDLRLVDPGADIYEMLDLCDRVRDGGKLFGIGADPAGTSAFVEEADTRGYTIEGSLPDLIGVRQSAIGLNDPIRRLERMALEDRLRADSGPCFGYAMNNVTTREAGAALVLERVEAPKKIDPVAALLCAAGVLILRRDQVVDVGSMIG
nr:terminase large subunit [Ruegeria lacuscaerulensis]